MRTTVEFDQQGHRVLGIEYSTARREEDERFAGAAKVAEQLDSIYSAVQLRIPTVPALVVSPRTGAFEPDHFTPLEDARITRNSFGWLKPDLALDTFEVDAEFDRRFSVTTSDPEFAAAVLTGEARALLLCDLWFRVHQVALHGDAMWTSESGGLTEDRTFGNSRRLAMLAAAIPSPIWEVWSGDKAFAAVAAGSDTSYNSWHGGRGGFVRTPVNRFRETADRQPLSSMSIAVRTLIAAVLVLPGLSTAVNSVAALTGVAPEVQLTVTKTIEGYADSSCSSCSQTDQVSGTYEFDGTIHRVDRTWWMSWTAMPEKGSVVEVSRGPVWWHPIIERPDTAVMMFLLALLPLLAGALLAKATYRPRPPRRVRKLRKAQETTIA
ncbi:hypothetical protein VSH64_40870 [Amycolatopsis rhabdoformis]|uniref:DUF2330 domain-containing protein n=1 Tax=Amycolatopsis rhabdoformis TaxID=1448059 RepID=A0ABZ1I6H8_9PSEU|nr:hypothetical protein [Amycolatopsis rhabdoformis]WSE29104.1 hypothetical protein VSH64_40870 [Amycolatopsis rhabdoformis]